MLPDLIQLNPVTAAFIEPPLEGLITYEILNSYEIGAGAALTVAGAVQAAEADMELTVGVATVNTELAPGAP